MGCRHDLSAKRIRLVILPPCHSADAANQEVDLDRHSIRQLLLRTRLEMDLHRRLMDQRRQQAKGQLTDGQDKHFDLGAQDKHFDADDKENAAGAALPPLDYVQ